jgi:uncharacterized membrane protein/protein-disulfide isomerase
MTTRRLRAPLIALCLLGLGASASSAYVHYRMLRDPSYTSFCDVNATINCESVYRSAYGSIAGVPVAVLGVLFFALALLLTFVSDVASERERVVRPKGRAVVTPPPEPDVTTSATYLFLLSTVGLSVVLYLGYASFFIVKAVCILCVLTYVAVIGIFMLSGAASAARLQAVPSMIGRDLRRLVANPVALTIGILYVAGAASAIAFFPRETTLSAPAIGEPAAGAPLAPPPAAQLAEFEAWMAAQPRLPIAEPTDGAKVVILKFNDYQCPPCRQTYNEYKPIIAKYQAQHPGEVKYVTKDFPLEPECNSGGPHVAGCEAAAAVRMARLKGKADALEAWLFDNQPAITPDLVRRGAREVGGIADFDVQYSRVLEQVRADVALGRQLGVGSTPTFFVNGVKIVGGLRPQFFDAAIAYELKRGGSAAEKR